MTSTIAEGIAKAAEIIDSGKAVAKLDELVQFCAAFDAQKA
jgi:anthranilate phosphoribosyltransferase